MGCGIKDVMQKEIIFSIFFFQKIFPADFGFKKVAWHHCLNFHRKFSLSDLIQEPGELYWVLYPFN